MSENQSGTHPAGGAFCSRSNAGDAASLSTRKSGDSLGGTVAECSPMFTGVMAGDYTGIFAAARVREYARGEMLYIEGEPVQQVALLTSGFVKMNKLGLNGAEVILRLGVTGDVLGAEDLTSTGKHCTTAQAFRLCRTLVWDAPAFKVLLQRYPVLHQNMVRILGAHLLELEERFREVATERVGPRVARQLVRLREKIGRPVNGAVEIGLSREELAQMTGTTLFTVSRLLSAWEALGMVSPRREAVTICDIQSLRAMSEES